MGRVLAVIIWIITLLSVLLFVAGKPAAYVNGNVRTNLLRWSHCARAPFSLQQSAGGIFDVAATRTPFVAGISTLLAAAVYLDGFEYLVSKPTN